MRTPEQIATEIWETREGAELGATFRAIDLMKAAIEADREQR